MCHCRHQQLILTLQALLTPARLMEERPRMVLLIWNAAFKVGEIPKFSLKIRNVTDGLSKTLMIGEIG